MENFLEVCCDVSLIKLREIDLDAEGCAVSFAHFNILDLSMLTESVFENLKFVECIRREMEIFNCVNPAGLCVLRVLNASNLPLIGRLVIHRQVKLHQIGHLL